MARVTAPLFALSARGSVGPALTYRRSAMNRVAGLRPAHSDAKTPAQLAHRAALAALAQQWRVREWSPIDLSAWASYRQASNDFSLYLAWLRYYTVPGAGFTPAFGYFDETNNTPFVGSLRLFTTTWDSQGSVTKFLFVGSTSPPNTLLASYSNDSDTIAFLATPPVPEPYFWRVAVARFIPPAAAYSQIFRQPPL